MRAAWAMGWAVLLATPAMAQAPSMPMGGEGHAQPNCPADAEPLPAPLAGWATRSALTAGTDATKLDGARIQIGRAVDLSLAPTPSMHYAVRPENPGGSVSHGGMVAFTVEAAGTYRVAISSAAWLDVVRDGVSLTSVGHGHGPACSGIRKMVDFSLQPGAYTLQVAGNGAPAISVIVARLP